MGGTLPPRRGLLPVPRQAVRRLTSGQGEAGYGHSDDPEPPFCSIRNLPIEDPFYACCCNHPHRRPERDPIPVGPVFTGDSSGARVPWQPSPDTEEIRLHLLDLLGGQTGEPTSEFPIGHFLDDVAVWQLGEFREARALDTLRRVTLFNPAARESGPVGRTREGLVRLAREAIAKIDDR